MRVQGKCEVSRLWKGVAMLAVAAVAWAEALPAAAQGPRGGRLDPEKQEAAWTLQAKGVAKSLELSEEAAAKLGTAYAASRQSHQAAMQKLREGGQQGAGMFQEYQKITTEERAKLKTALDEAVGAEKAEKAIAPLGSFHRQWDRYADAISGLGLDEEKQFKALDLIAAYVVESDAAAGKAMEGGDFQAVRTAMEESKGKLDTGLKEVLSEDEFTKWTEATASRGGGFGGGGGGGGRNREN